MKPLIYDTQGHKLKVQLYREFLTVSHLLSCLVAIY